MLGCTLIQSDECYWRKGTFKQQKLSPVMHMHSEKTRWRSHHFKFITEALGEEAMAINTLICDFCLHNNKKN